MSRTDPWFRMYHATLDNPKVQKLSGEHFKTWVNLLCLACRTAGRLPCDADIAFALRVPETKVQPLLKRFIDAELVDVDGDGLVMHDWDTLQYQSDVSTTRVQRFRERRMKRSGNVSCNVSATPHETDQIQNRDRADKTEANASGERKRSAPKVGTRISPDWKPNERNLEDAKNRGYHAADIERLAQHFRDYHLAKGTVSKDWDASWRTWLANDAKFSAQRGNGATGQQSRHNGSQPGSIVDLANRLKARAGVGGQNHRDGGMGRGSEWVQAAGDERDESGVGFGAGGIVLEADECERMHRSAGGTETADEGAA